MGTCLDYGSGEYRLLVIDKDFIMGEFIDAFIDVLRQYPGIRGGRCILNTESGAVEAYNVKIFLDLKTNRFLYTSDHPTGYFFSQECIELENQIMNGNPNRWNPFNEDMLLARCASCGDMLLYKAPLVYSLLAKPVKNVEKSNTYTKKKDNVYFEPDQRIWQMHLYIEHLNTLGLSKEEYEETIKIIYQRTFQHVTTNYGSTMRTEQICEHYGLKPRKVNLIEMTKNVRTLNKELMNNKGCKVSNSRKRMTIFLYAMKIPYKITRSFIRGLRRKNNHEYDKFYLEAMREMNKQYELVQPQ